MTHQNAFKILFAAGLLLTGDVASAQITKAKTPVIASKPKMETSTTGSHYTPWKPIAEKDIVKKVRVWEDIEIVNNNELFAAKNKGNDLMDVIIAGVSNGKLSVEEASDQLPRKKLSREECMQQIAKTKNSPVTKYRLTEDSLWLNTGEVVMRIVFIAPIVSVKPAIGSAVEKPLFWAFYFDARDHFSSYPASETLSWDEVLVGRHFTGTITKRKLTEYGQTASKLNPVK